MFSDYLQFAFQSILIRGHTINTEVKRSVSGSGRSGGGGGGGGGGGFRRGDRDSARGRNDRNDMNKMQIELILVDKTEAVKQTLIHKNKHEQPAMIQKRTKTKIQKFLENKGNQDDSEF